MALLIARGRKEREIDPAIRAIDMCVTQAETEADLNPAVLSRMRAMQDFLATADKWSNQMLSVPKSNLSALMKMGNKVLTLLKVGGSKAN